MRFTAVLISMLCLPLLAENNPLLSKKQKPKIIAQDKASAISKLGLEDLQKLVQEQYPPLLMARIERDIASGKLMQAWGKFDPKVSAFANVGLDGYYDGNLYEFKVQGRDTDGPMRFYSGYRYSDGILPSYEKKRTSAGGQVFLGIELPLLQDSEIDEARLKLMIADIGRERVEPALCYQRITLMAKARKSYLNWIAYGIQLGYVEGLLQLAEKRTEFLNKKIEQGELAAIVALDNQRIIVKRRLELSKALEKFRASAIELSMFIRDKDGDAIVPERAQVPQTFPSISIYKGGNEQQEKMVLKALENRPEILANDLELRLNSLSLDGVENEFKPRLDLRLEGGVHMGSPAGYKDKDMPDLRVGLNFSMPLSRRDARGKLLMLGAKEMQLDLKRRNLMVKLRQAVVRSFNHHTRGLGQLKLAEENLLLSQDICSAEDKKFRSGEGDLLSLQIREKQLFEAKSSLVEAQIKLYKSWAELEEAMGLPLKK